MQRFAERTTQLIPPPGTALYEDVSDRLGQTKNQHNSQMKRFQDLKKRYDTRPLKYDERIRHPEDSIQSSAEPVDMSMEVRLKRSKAILESFTAVGPGGRPDDMDDNLRYLEKMAQLRKNVYLEQKDMYHSIADLERNTFLQWEAFAKRQLKLQQAKAKRFRSAITMTISVTAGIAVAAGTFYLLPTMIPLIAAEGTAMHAVLLKFVTENPFAIAFQMFGVVKFTTEQISEVLQGEKDTKRAAALIAKKIGTATVTLTVTGVIVPYISGPNPSIWGSIKGTLTGQMINGVFTAAADWLIVPEKKNQPDMQAEQIIRMTQLKHEVDHVTGLLKEGMTLDDIEAMNHPRARIVRFFQRNKGKLFATVLALGSAYALFNISSGMIAHNFPWLAGTLGFLGDQALYVSKKIAKGVGGIVQWIDNQIGLSKLFLQMFVVPPLVSLIVNSRLIRWFTEQLTKRIIQGLDFVVPDVVRRKIEEKLGFDLVRNWFVTQIIHMFVNVLVGSTASMAVTTGFKGLGILWKNFDLATIGNIHNIAYDSVMKYAYGFNPTTARTDFRSMINDAYLEHESEFVTTTKQTLIPDQSAEPFLEGVSDFDIGRFNQKVQETATNIETMEMQLQSYKSTLNSIESQINRLSKLADVNPELTDAVTKLKTHISSFENVLSQTKADYSRKMWQLLNDIKIGKLKDNFDKHVENFATVETPDTSELHGQFDIASKLLDSFQKQTYSKLTESQQKQLFIDNMKQRMGLELTMNDLKDQDPATLESKYQKIREMDQGFDNVRTQIDMMSKRLKRFNSTLRRLRDIGKQTGQTREIRAAIAAARQQASVFSKELGKVGNLIPKDQRGFQAFLKRGIITGGGELDKFVDSWLSRIQDMNQKVAELPKLPSLGELGLPKTILRDLAAGEWNDTFPKGKQLTSDDIHNPEQLLEQITNHQIATDQVKMNIQRLTQLGVRIQDQQNLLDDFKGMGEWLWGDSSKWDTDVQSNFRSAYQNVETSNQLLNNMLQKAETLQTKLENVQTPDQLQSTLIDVNKGLNELNHDMTQLISSLNRIGESLRNIDRMLDDAFKLAGYDNKNATMTLEERKYAEFLSSRMSQGQLEKLSEKLGYDLSELKQEAQDLAAGTRKNLSQKTKRGIRAHMKRLREELPDDAYEEFKSCFEQPAQLKCIRTAAGPTVATTTAFVATIAWNPAALVSVTGLPSLLTKASSTSGTVRGMMKGLGLDPKFNMAEFYLEFGTNAIINGDTIVSNLYEMMGAGTDMYGFSMLAAGVKLGYNSIPWDLVVLGDGRMRNLYRMSLGRETINPMFSTTLPTTDL